MFGDVFGMNGDYTLGTFYQGRRKFLVGDEGSLEPPLDFKTKKQMRKVILANQSGEEVSFHINFLKDEKNSESSNAKAQIRKQDGKQKQKKQSQVIYINKFSSLNRDEWSQEIQAGCKIWINKKTGEVSPTCPWMEQESDYEDPSSPSKDVDDSEGTGSLVYDSKEVEELIKFLDNGGRMK